MAKFGRIAWKATYDALGAAVRFVVFYDGEMYTAVMQTEQRGSKWEKSKVIGGTYGPRGYTDAIRYAMDGMRHFNAKLDAAMETKEQK